jgi:hypothetical protein
MEISLLEVCFKLTGYFKVCLRVARGADLAVNSVGEESVVTVNPYCPR